MKLKNIELPMAEIERFCQRWNLTEFALSGSVLRDDFCIDSSDIDVMIQYQADAIPTFYDLDCMESDLEKLFGRAVDVVTRKSIEHSKNYLRRQEILSSASVIYESGSPVSA